MEAVYPAAGRGRRLRRSGPAARLRRHTMPVTFAEIKEVDEEMEEASKSREVPRVCPPPAAAPSLPPADTPTHLADT